MHCLTRAASASTVQPRLTTNSVRGVPLSLKRHSHRFHSVRPCAGAEDKEQQQQQQQQAQNTSSMEDDLPKLTTWQYGKTKDPGLVTYYMVAAFLVPILLIVAPLVTSPPK
ncbi:hypothetical protein DUNSADRAFT_12394 [Dunaliella salina]|uniref:Uncharacterized protein n=1 Tax=Dunaliella salina TaxID=3046 RepID=A0ABQ7GBC1_DUNSA|nr:hypothetical protein DUNSADRAFT_12394 [Dunaliella salina]|eukprot:KAF5831907.1 hypothetical protein DUNSADRAFT_12394 [Dunaliella salina]